MRLLLDTHVLIWFYEGNSRMSAAALSAILDPLTEKWISPASYWEIAIKIGNGKLTLDEPFGEFIQHAIYDDGFSILPIKPLHTEILTTLPRHHGDPFDRMIISQSIAEGMTLNTADTLFDNYPITRIW